MIGEKAGEHDGNEDPEPQLSKEEVGRNAVTLASDPRFQAARSRAQLLYAAKRVFDGAVIGNSELLAAVIDEAKRIFEIEIKPTKERQLAEEVATLRKRGLTKLRSRKGFRSRQVG